MITIAKEHGKKDRKYFLSLFSCDLFLKED
jgi:hypothetical protein